MIKSTLNTLILLLSHIITFSSSVHAFTFNNNREARFSDSKINVYIADHACDVISSSASDLVDLTHQAAQLFWNTVNTSSLHLEVKGKKIPAQHLRMRVFAPHSQTAEVVSLIQISGEKKGSLSLVITMPMAMGLPAASWESHFQITQVEVILLEVLFY